MAGTGTHQALVAVLGAASEIALEELARAPRPRAREQSDRSATRVIEAPLLVDPVAALVDTPVVTPTQRDQVAERRRLTRARMLTTEGMHGAALIPGGSPPSVPSRPCR